MTKFTVSIHMSIVALFALVSMAAADTATLNGVNGAVQGGVYVSPYYGTVNGAPAASGPMLAIR